MIRVKTGESENKESIDKIKIKELFETIYIYFYK
jgi:hypothetical protein